MVLPDPFPLYCATGIIPTSPGYTTFDVRPQVGDLTSATIVRPSLAGEIALSYSSTGGWHLQSAANTVARVCLPACGAEQGSSRNVLLVNGVVREVDAEGCAAGLVGGVAWHVVRVC